MYILLKLKTINILRLYIILFYELYTFFLTNVMQYVPVNKVRVIPTEDSVCVNVMYPSFSSKIHLNKSFEIQCRYHYWQVWWRSCIIYRPIAFLCNLVRNFLNRYNVLYLLSLYIPFLTVKAFFPQCTSLLCSFFFLFTLPSPRLPLLLPLRNLSK